jgi:hypothetical protein
MILPPINQRTIKVRWRTVSHGRDLDVMAEWVAPNGLRYRAGYGPVNTQGVPVMEQQVFIEGMFEVVRKRVTAEWEAHRAVVNPIDNGPADAVAQAEATTRLVQATEEAIGTSYGWMEEALDELQAAYEAWARATRLTVPFSTFPQPSTNNEGVHHA